MIMIKMQYYYYCCCRSVVSVTIVRHSLFIIHLTFLLSPQSPPPPPPGVFGIWVDGCFSFERRDVSIKWRVRDTRPIHLKIAIILLMVIHHPVDLFPTGSNTRAVRQTVWRCKSLFYIIFFFFFQINNFSPPSTTIEGVSTYFPLDWTCDRPKWFYEKWYSWFFFISYLNLEQYIHNIIHHLYIEQFSRLYNIYFMF